MEVTKWLEPSGILRKMPQWEVLLVARWKTRNLCISMRR